MCSECEPRVKALKQQIDDALQARAKTVSDLSRGMEWALGSFCLELLHVDPMARGDMAFVRARLLELSQQAGHPFHGVAQRALVKTNSGLRL